MRLCISSCEVACGYDKIEQQVKGDGSNYYELSSSSVSRWMTELGESVHEGSES